MGLSLLDNVAVEVLADHCAATRTHEFLFVAAPLRIRGATGSTVNPLAVFLSRQSDQFAASGSA
jgi:kynurenine formamidase